MTLLAFKDLRSDVIRSSTDCSFPLAVEFELCGESEISDFDFHLIVEEQVTELKISMDDSVRVEVLNGITDLDDIALYL